VVLISANRFQLQLSDWAAAIAGGNGAGRESWKGRLARAGNLFPDRMLPGGSPPLSPQLKTV